MLFTTRPHVTHEVLNQVPPLAGHDVAQDPALLEALDREGASAVLGEAVSRSGLALVVEALPEIMSPRGALPRLTT